MTKKVFIFVLLMLLFSILYAFHTYDLTIEVNDLAANPVASAEVFVDTPTQNVSGLTDANGSITFTLDDHPYEAVMIDTLSMIRGGMSPSGSSNTTDNRNMPIRLEVTIQPTDNTQSFSAVSEEYTINEDATKSLDVNYDPVYNVDSINVDVFEEQPIQEYLLPYLVAASLDNDYELSLQNAPFWAILVNDQLEFDLTTNSENIMFEVLLQDPISNAVDTLEVAVDVTNYDPAFTTNSLALDVQEDISSSYDLTAILSESTLAVDIYSLELVNAPDWVIMNGDLLEFDLVNNSADVNFSVTVYDSNDPISNSVDTLEVVVDVTNFDPAFTTNSLALDVQEDIFSSYDLSTVISDSTLNMGGFTLGLDAAPDWASLSGNEIHFNLIDNANDVGFDITIRDSNDPFEITDIITINLSITNYTPQFTEDAISIDVTEDTFQTYELTDIINSALENYALAIQNNPTWVSLVNETLQFNLQVNNPLSTVDFQLQISDLTGEPDTQTLSVTLDITNVNDVPVLGLIPNLTASETDNHTIIFDLNPFIQDEETDFDHLIIETDFSFSTAEAVFVYNAPFLEAYFFPDAYLAFHQDNTLTFTISISDGEHTLTSNTVSWSYQPFLTAIKGFVLNHYTEQPVNGSTITSPNDYEGAEIILSNDNADFVAFFDVEYANIILESDDYYYSSRYIYTQEDREYNFTLIPVQIDEELGYDNIEAGFDQAFRYAGQQGGEYFQGTTKYITDDVTVFICTDSTYYGYAPTTGDIEKVNVSLSYYNDFTNGLINPYTTTNVIVNDDLTACVNAINTPGYITFYWYAGTGGSGSNGRTLNGHTIINSNANVNTVGGSTPSQAIHNQELTQAIGPGFDQGHISPSTFCTEIASCLLTNIPTPLDHLWMQRNYDRAPGNMEDDIDYIPAERGNVFTEVVRIAEEFLPSGEKIQTLEYLGYYYADAMFWSYEDIFTELPEGAKLIKTINPDNYGVINKSGTAKLVLTETPEAKQTILYDAYPNPFNPTTTISFSTIESSKPTNLTIYNIKGQKVTTLVNDVLPAGNYSVVWNASGHT